MFNFFKKKNEPESLFSPVIGKCVPIETVPDKMFAAKLLGDGVGFVFEGDTVFAPCDGEIMMIAHTKHAFGMKSKTGAEVLVHIGLNTVELNGKGLEVLVNPGQRVKAHQPIIKIDRSFMEEHQIDLTTPMIITNMDDLNLELINHCEVELNSIVMTVKKQ